VHPYIQYVNPHLGDQIQRLKLDKRFIRGEGRFLYDHEGNKYLDFIASYGALPFGYNPPRIWEAILKVKDSLEPSFSQPSALEAAGALGKRLIEVAPSGLSYVTFTNSGTESTEAAIKLARSTTKKFRILSTTNSFHGKTMGALSATGRASYQKVFGAPIEGFDFIPYGDIDALKDALTRRGHEYAAFIVEPIQGEGGIIVPPLGYLKAVKDLCSDAGVLLILDEVQTGLGRTGRLFACEEEGVTPDIMILAKALGGGLLPIGACLATEDAYNEDFALKHSSTFAGNALASRVGLAVLDMLTEDEGALLKDVAAKGERLKKSLQEIAKEYPHVVKEVRGKGLMIGVDFNVTEDTFPETMLGVMADQEMLTPVLASYLLNVERLRVAPTLNGSSVIRIEPSLNVTDHECQWAEDAFSNMLSILGQGNTAGLVSHLIDVPLERTISTQDRVEPMIEEKACPTDDPEEGRFAFLVHPVNLSNYAEFDRTLKVFDEDETRRLSERWVDLIDPFVVSKARIKSITGKEAYGEFIALPHTADALMAMSRKESVALVRSAVELAMERGARVVGLGAYTSVVTRGGKELEGIGVALTTGNSYTAASAVDASLEALGKFGLSLSQVKAAVVGATGSIGRLTAILLSEGVQQIFLVGNPRSAEASKRRLLKVAAELYQHLIRMMADGKTFPGKSIGAELARLSDLPAPDAPLEDFIELAARLDKKFGPVVVTTALEKVLPMVDLTITATSSVCELITPEMLKYGAIVCDMSRPPNVSRTVKDARADVLVIDGGVIALPGLPSLGWDFGFEKGLAYACMSETFMLALEHHYENFSIGTDFSLESVEYTKELAKKHGFTLAGLRSFDRPLSQEEWEKVCTARLRVSAV
jgi:acetylornithine/succinyldiaminopimelate/putrescine aminotransferase/predicted amino acid dehydrogenase